MGGREGVREENTWNCNAVVGAWNAERGQRKEWRVFNRLGVAGGQRRKRD